MERSVYLEKLRVAVWHEEHGGVREEDIIVYEGIQCYPCGYYLTYGGGEWKHTAVLHEVNSRAVRWVKLSEVEDVQKA